MAGTVIGGKKAARANKERHGADFYAQIGSIGGKSKTSKPKGFAANPDLARKVGAIGGARSRRGKAKNPDLARKVEAIGDTRSRRDKDKKKGGYKWRLTQLVSRFFTKK